ncbi:nitrate ABC transporter permease [Pseudoclavibacter endophyticus]|nr:ABC transporter permease [Pseudoclavibacter endophyticus]GGA64735.1 nitrate ABC transporter permease [Pseudoclavibacter endophyticus]
MTQLETRSPATEAPGDRTRRTLASVGYVVVPLVVVVALWQVATMVFQSTFFPTPLAILQRLGTLLTSTGPASPVTSDLLPSVTRMLLGFALGSLWGVVVGVWLGLSRATREVVTPVVEFLRSIPATAVLPLFIVLFGGGDDMRVLFIAYGCSWFVLINTASGVASIHKTTLDMGQVFRVARWRQVLGIVLPASMPTIFAGLRIASTAALLLAIVSEFMVATNGIGYQLIQAQGRFLLLDMWVWMLVLAILGLLMNAALEGIEGRVLRWHRLSRER